MMSGSGEVQCRTMIPVEVEFMWYTLAPTGKKKGNIKNTKKTKTYNTEDSQVVTDPSTNSALSSLSMGERTGSRVFWKLWLYVKVSYFERNYIYTYYSTSLPCPAIVRRNTTLHGGP